MVEANRRNHLYSELLGRAQPPVASDDGAARVSEERIREAERLDRVRNLADLLRRVCSRVSPTRRERIDRALFDMEVVELGATWRRLSGENRFPIRSPSRVVFRTLVSAI
jgi:hypothetical protein